MRFQGIDAYSGNKPFIFLSYSHKDAEYAEEITRALMDAGYRVWYDEGLTPAQEWDENVARSVEKCSYLLALISQNYLDSENCRDELNYARDCDKPRLLIYLENVDLPSGMRMRLGRLQALFKWEYADTSALIKKISCAEGIENCRCHGDISTSYPKTHEKGNRRFGVQVFDSRKSKYLVLLVLFFMIAAVAVFVLRDKAAAPEPANILLSDYAGIDTNHITEDTITIAENSAVFGMDLKRKQISVIHFYDSITQAPSDAVNISASEDASVLAWTIKEGTDLYSLNIGAKGGVVAPCSCSQLFAGYTNLVSIDFNHAFHMDHVEDVSGMFMYCIKLKRIENIEFRTSDVKDFSFMFYHCEALSYIPLTDFDTQKAETFGCMFEKCRALGSLDFSTFRTKNVKDYSWMFAYCYFGELDLRSFDTSGATRMFAMFVYCPKLQKIHGLENFDTHSVEDMSWMFYGCSKLDLTGVKSLDTSNVKAYDHFMSDSMDPNWQELFNK